MVNRILTRLLDIVIALFGLTVMAFMLPWISLLIKLDSPGPVFYSCDRVGKDGHLFKMYKFRTMFNAPILLGANVSPAGDPRVTPVGRWLRRLKLNEVPQFFNVLKGDMTLVGPRPESPDLAAYYPPEARQIFYVKPGIAGPNQISGRNEEDAYPRGVDPKKFYLEHLLPGKIAVDLEYVAKKSFWTDLKFLFMASWVTVSKTIGRQHLIDNLSQILMVLADLAVCLVSFTLAHVIRFDGFGVSELVTTFLSILPFTAIARFPIFIYFGFYHTLIRHFTIYDVKRIIQGVAVSSSLLILVWLFLSLSPRGYSRSVFIIDLFCLTTLLILYRVGLKVLQNKFKAQSGNGEAKPRVVIWGTGETGILCARYLAGCQNPGYEMVGFIDDDPKMQNRRVNGHRVLGDHHHLGILTHLYKIEAIFVAKSQALPLGSKDLERLCQRLSLSLKYFRSLLMDTPPVCGKFGDYTAAKP